MECGRFIFSIPILGASTQSVAGAYFFPIPQPFFVDSCLDTKHHQTYTAIIGIAHALIHGLKAALGPV